MSEAGNAQDPRDVLREMTTWDEFNSFTNQSALITYREVFGEDASQESLVEIMGNYDPAATLGGIAELGWLNDKSVNEGAMPHLEVAEGIDQHFQTSVADLVRSGRVVLSRMSISKLVELVTYCSVDAAGGSSPTLGQMGRMLLAANELCDGINASYPEVDMVTRFLESGSPAELQNWIDELSDEQFDDWVVDFAANQQNASLHYRHDILETLAPPFLDTWRSPLATDIERWPASSCMADVFRAELGFDVLEYSAAGIDLYASALSGGGQIFNTENISRLMKMPVWDEIKKRAVIEFGSDGEALRDIYSQQRFPIISIKGQYFVPDSQKLLRRFLETPVELDLLSSVGGDSSRRSEVKRMLDSRFEGRVSNRLKRIVRSCQGATLFDEHELQSHFSERANRKQKGSCCDWVISSQFASVYLEATSRTVPLSVAAPGGSGRSLDGDLERYYFGRKFRQIVSTFDNEIMYGLPGGKPGNARPVRFGFVVLPRGGFISETALEAIFRSSVEKYLPSELMGEHYSWLPIGILNESDLTLLEGWSEYRGIDASRLLYDWRLASVQTPAPLSLEDFAAMRGLDRPLPSRDVKRAELFRKLCVATRGWSTVEPD